VAANPFVAILGKPETASARLTLTQALNSLGTTLAPFFGSALILATVAKSADELKAMAPAAREAYRLAEAASVQKPYVGLAITLFILAGAIAWSKLPRSAPAMKSRAKRRGQRPKSALATATSCWRGCHLCLCGRRSGDRQLLGQLPEGTRHRGFARESGRDLSALLLGRRYGGPLLGTPLLRYFRPGRVLALFACIACILVLTTMITSGRWRCGPCWR